MKIRDVYIYGTYQLQVGKFLDAFSPHSGYNERPIPVYKVKINNIL